MQSIHPWIQLKHWKTNAKIDNDKARWMTFFKNGKTLDPDKLPKELDTREMRQAMTVLKTFSEKDENYFRYLSRWFAEKDLLTFKKTMETQKLELARAIQEKRKYFRALKKEQAEKARLLNLLKRSGIDPNDGQK